MTRRRAALALLLGLAVAWWLRPVDAPAPAVQALAEAPEAAVTPREPRRRRAPAAGRAPAPLPADVPIATLTCPLPAEALLEADRWRMGLRVKLPDGSTRRRLFGGSIGDEQRAAGAIQVPTDLAPSEGTLDLPGWARAEVRLTEDGCTIANLQRAATLTGLVRTPPGVGGERILVQGCGGSAETDSTGAFLLEADPEPCTLRASRQDGLFAAYSAPIEVRPGSGEELIIDLDLPPFRMAGVGVGLRDTEAGTAITWVSPDGPAAAAGLQPGDVIIGLNDEDVSGLSATEVVPAATGPEDTEITYHVLRGDEERSFTMTRQAMDHPR